MLDPVLSVFCRDSHLWHISKAFEEFQQINKKAWEMNYKIENFFVIEKCSAASNFKKDKKWKKHL